MMLSLIWAMNFWYQPPPVVPESPPEDSSLMIWEEIAGLENLIRDSVNKKSRQFTIFTSDPVRGYYVDRMGVYLLVPVRYQPALATQKVESSALIPHDGESVSLAESDLKRRLRRWNESLQKETMNKDAEFELVIGAMKSLLPDIANRLAHLPKNENLTIIIEEREPAWAQVGFRIGNHKTRKLVTLRVEKQALTDVYSSETTFSKEWLDKIKRTNASRPIIP